MEGKKGQATREKSATSNLEKCGISREDGEKSGKSQKGVARRHALILFHRASAHKMAQQLLRQWNVRIEQEEVVSISDLALCEAAKGYDERKGTKFVTYLYFYLHGFLIREIIQRKRNIYASKEEGVMERLMAAEMSQQYEDGSLDFSSNQIIHPDDQAYAKEMREGCAKALRTLSELEQEIVLRVHVFDFKVATVARQLGYSRGQVSELRRRAFLKLREDHNLMQLAA